MILFIIFILILLVQEFDYIKNKANNDNKLKIVYIVLAIIALATGLFYFINNDQHSLSYYIFKLLNIHY